MKLSLTMMLLAFATACGGARPSVATMPPDARVGWNRCETQVERWCTEHSHETTCLRDESERYAGLAASARDAYLASHGCPATP